MFNIHLKNGIPAGRDLKHSAKHFDSLKTGCLATKIPYRAQCISKERQCPKTSSLACLESPSVLVSDKGRTALVQNFKSWYFFGNSQGTKVEPLWWKFEFLVLTNFARFYHTKGQPKMSSTTSLGNGSKLSRYHCPFKTWGQRVGHQPDGIPYLQVKKLLVTLIMPTKS